MIYFLVAKGNRGKSFVKIGYSKDVERRVKEIQTMCPLKVSLWFVMDGNLQTEAGLHQYYKEFKIPHTNEWFHLHGELLNSLEYWKASKSYKPKSVEEFTTFMFIGDALNSIKKINPSLHKRIYKVAKNRKGKQSI